MPPGLRLSDISPKILVAVTQQWREALEKNLVPSLKIPRSWRLLVGQASPVRDLPTIVLLIIRTILII